MEAAWRRAAAEPARWVDEAGAGQQGDTPGGFGAQKTSEK